MSADDANFTLEIKFVQACIKLLGRNPEVRHLSAVSCEAPGVKHPFEKGSSAWVRQHSEPQKQVFGVLGEFSLL